MKKKFDKTENEASHFDDTIAMLPSEYSLKMYQWKSKGSLKATIHKLITLKELNKKELILLIELIKDNLDNNHEKLKRKS